MEIKIDINRNTTISLSKQIYQSIADRISSGLLEKGSRFKVSVRYLIFGKFRRCICFLVERKKPVRCCKQNTDFIGFRI